MATVIGIEVYVDCRHRALFSTNDEHYIERTSYNTYIQNTGSKAEDILCYHDIMTHLHKKKSKVSCTEKWKGREGNVQQLGDKFNYISIFVSIYASK